MSIWAEQNSESGVPHHLRDDNEQYSLPIVVQVERGETYSENDAFQALSIALGEMFSTDAWSETVERWMMGRIRKVTRRARGTQWDALNELDSFSGNSGNVNLKIFEPHLLEDIQPVLRKLQVQGLSLNPFIEDVDAPNENNILYVAINPDLVMSSGKMIAQVGHGIQLAIRATNEDFLTKWKSNGYKLKVCNWNTMPDNSCFITDAGLTEIPAGSLTVKSFIM